MIEATEDYARLVEEGHGAHPIYPKAGRGTVGPLRRGQSRGRSKAGTDRLVFRVGGRLVFAKMVNHPGARAYPFMGPAAEKAERVLFMKLEHIDTRLQRIWR